MILVVDGMTLQLNFSYPKPLFDVHVLRRAWTDGNAMPCFSVDDLKWRSFPSDEAGPRSKGRCCVVANSDVLIRVESFVDRIPIFPCLTFTVHLNLNVFTNWYN